MTSKEIVKDVFGFEPPVYQLYEWINIKGGQQFSSSKGVATSLSDVAEIYEPGVLRFLFVGTRPNKGFQISFDDDVIKLYDDFDALEEKYFSKDVNPQEKRIYELSVLDVPKKKPERESFRHLVTLVQVGKVGNLSKGRAEMVKNWLEKYASEDRKFEVQDKVKIKLSKDDKELLSGVRKVLAGAKNADGLQEALYEFAKTNGKDLKEFFKLMYGVILNKERGPRLGGLIFAIGKAKVIKLIGQVK